ncbi:MAG: O-antigen ligase family protein [Prevotella ruminicola]|uniref:O-antigen ligase family protein n=1 Tax=Xylanibacter ruminicola TaxID=839 RepID=A0A9D5P7C4_XYLRU|nr:O-antigen ligase family protein [Xylanibacter ruminicola]
MNASLKRFSIADFVYLSGLFVMLISQYLTVITNIKFIGAALCLIYLLLSGNINFDKKYYRWILSFNVLFLLSFLWSPNVKVSAIVFFSHLIPYYLLTFATIKYFSSYQKLDTICFAVFVSGLILIAYVANNMDEFVLGERFGSDLNDDPEERAWNVNSIGMCFSYSIFAGFFLFNKKNVGLIRKALFISSFILMGFAALLTGSRKVLLMLVIPIFYFSYNRFKKHFLLGLVLLLVLVGAGYYLIMNVEALYTTIGQRTEDMFAVLSGNGTGYEDNSRQLLALKGLEWWQDNPILGVGINCFKELSNVDPLFRGKHWYAHNNYVELLVDVGVVGFFLYYRGVYYLLRESLKKKSNAMSFVFIMTIMVLVLDTGNVSYYDMRVQLLIVILFGILRLEKKKNLIKSYEAS